MGVKISLRRKAISKGRQSLYLDFYPHVTHPDTGKVTRREFLKMYVFEKPRTLLDKRHNEETLTIAELIRQKRESLLNRPEIYTEFEKKEIQRQEKGKQDFLAFYTGIVRKRNGSNYDNWTTSQKHFQKFIKKTKDFPFNQIDDELCSNYREYLLKAKSLKRKDSQISTNTAFSYFNKFITVLKEAFKFGYLDRDISLNVTRIKEVETNRQYLTIEELNALVKTPCDSDLVKRMCLFSALTGLRSSDIKKLVWSEVEYSEKNGSFLRFRQQKTKGMETLPIAEQAVKLMGERKEGNVLVFKKEKSVFYQNKILAEWVKEANISKKITFHCFRHTYATLQLTNGTDIYTISKMLGHKDIQTTQIYAKIVDDKKREATTKISLDIEF